MLLACPSFRYLGTGQGMSIVANRLSFCLDLRGPSLVANTVRSPPNPLLPTSRLFPEKKATTRQLDPTRALEIRVSQACSSGLVAIALAHSSMLQGGCSAAVAAAVDLLLGPVAFGIRCNRLAALPTFSLTPPASLSPHPNPHPPAPTHPHPLFLLILSFPAHTLPIDVSGIDSHST